MHSSGHRQRVIHSNETEIERDIYIYIYRESVSREIVSREREHAFRDVVHIAFVNNLQMKRAQRSRKLGGDARLHGH